MQRVDAQTADRDAITASIHEMVAEVRKYVPGYALRADPQFDDAREEWDGNAFVRLWRGLDEESEERCRVGGEEAVLVLFAPDYDGGHKAWVRWTETGRDDIVPGSAVERLDD